MRYSVRRAIPVIFAAAAIWGAAGCSQDEPGTPIPTGNPTSAPQASSSATPSAAAADVDSVQPCSLLTKSEAAQFGKFEAPEKKTLGTARVCDWLPVRTDASTDLPSFGFAVRDNVGVDGINDAGNGIQTGHVSGSGRDYALTSSVDSCTIALAVGDGARVDVNVTGVEEQQACDLASKLVDIVDPKLPKA